MSKPRDRSLATTATVTLAVALAVGLGACGRKAPNLPVEGGHYPRIYPDPETVTAPAEPETPDPWQLRPEELTY